jgi:hypothetical protein
MLQEDLMRWMTLVTLCLLGALGCASTVEDAASGTTSGSGGAATGATGTGGCNTMLDDAPSIFPSCPGGGTCPDCGQMTGMGGPILEGEYFMTHMTVWDSGCGAVAEVVSQATLEIQGGTIQLVSTGPTDFEGTTATVHATLMYTEMGTELDVTQPCPAGSPPSTIAYTSVGNTLILASLPGVLGTPTFTHQ